MKEFKKIYFYDIMLLGDTMSRMDRYYENNYAEKKRSRMNQDLYRSIYKSDEYSNIEGIATMDKTNEIDISKIRGMLKSREEYNSQKAYRDLFKKTEEVLPQNDNINEEEYKNYDIRDILEKVKQEKQADEKYRSIDNTNYNLLKELKIQDRKREIEENEEELKELINTITNTSVLNKMGDQELSLGLLGDLKSTDNTISDSKSIKKILEEAKSKELEETNTNSFYTKGLNFSKKDLESYEVSMIDRRRKRNIKIVVACIILMVAIAIGIMIYTFIV